VAELGLRHAVITAVTRDDLGDGGAGQFHAVTTAIRTTAPGCRVELLIPDLSGDRSALQIILAARPDVLGHNLETVARLYPQARAGASYGRSLALLAAAREVIPDLPTKSGLMLGLGEERDEVLAAFADLRGAGVGMLTLGQYLQPTRAHLPVARYLPPGEFAELRACALGMGFTRVAAGPLVRSSYHAAELFEEPIS
jgi:lipoic acid synthetase